MGNKVRIRQNIQKTFDFLPRTTYSEDEII